VTPIAVPRLRWVAHATVEVGAPIPLDVVPDGRRQLIPVRGGQVTGEWNGTVLDGGADRQTVHDDGSVTIDARYPVQIDDGTTVIFVARGVRIAGDGGGAFATSLLLVGEAPEGVGATVYLATGRKGVAAVEFDIFEVA
jgi:hypothetical protein